jgi:hypothetical protein
MVISQADAAIAAERAAQRELNRARVDAHTDLGQFNRELLQDGFTITTIDAGVRREWAWGDNDIMLVEPNPILDSQEGYYPDEDDD